MDLPTSISQVDLGPDDVLVVHIGVGSLPAAGVKKYIESMMPKLNEVFGTQPMIVLPTKDVQTTHFSVIHRRADDRRMFSVDVGDMTPEQARVHVSKLRRMFQERVV